MKKVKLKSPAKINLVLEVIGQTSHGFHNIRSIMVKLENIYDEIKITFDNNKKGIKIICDDRKIPADEKNIIWKIADAFFEKLGKRVGLSIELKKGIPSSSGLGGGSSDGATTLLALNNYFGNPFNQKELISMAVEVGKDIPFFLQKEKVAYVEGMGERLTPIKKVANFFVLVVGIKGKISTAWAYGELDKKLIFMKSKKRVHLSAEFIKHKKDIQKWKCLLYNDFKIVAKAKYREIETIETALVSFGALGTSLSGKGPTIFGIFDNKKMMLEAKKSIEKYFPNYFVKMS